MKLLINKIINLPKKTFMNIKYFFASNNFKKLIKNKNIKKSIFTIVIAAFLLAESFAWLYDEYAGAGAYLSAGRISHSVIQYDKDGNEIQDDNEVQTIIYEENMSNITVGTKYIEIQNTGTLDMEYSFAFSTEGTTELAGVLYYRIYEVTSDVEDTLIGTYSSKLEAYAAANQPSSSMEYDTLYPISNMSLLKNDLIIDTLDAPLQNQTSSRVYRLDYGMYSAVQTSTYSNESMSVHLNIYSSQVGVISSENREGQIWEVQTEAQFREVLNSVVTGDTIKLLNNINISGSINITKAVGLDLNGYNLNITQDLIYEYVNAGDFSINASGYGTLTIGEDFIINTPKANVELIGANGTYDMSVGGEFSVNALQDGEENGLYLNNVRIVKTTTGLVPVDIMVASNTRITTGPDVILGYITAVSGSTNIEVINNGAVTQLNFSNMTLQDTYTKPQIYVYNLGEIYGILGSYSIILPPESTPYDDSNPLAGNTKIVKGITSGDITVGGSENFNNGDINDSETEVSVAPIEDYPNGYIVYIKEPTDTLQGLLEAYFTNEGSINVSGDIAAIEKMIVWTLNAQFFEAEDFVYANSSSMSSLSYLSLYNCKVTDGTTSNKIPAHAFQNNTTLTNIVLPKALVEVGEYAFSGVALGVVPGSLTSEFVFVDIPSSVTTIGDYAFDSSVHIRFSSTTPATIGTNTFNSTNARIFVPNGSIGAYQAVNGYPDEHIYIYADISDTREYFVFEVPGGLGISYIYNNNLANSATSLGIPNTIKYKGSFLNVIEIGTNSYRGMNIPNSNGVTLVLPSTVTRIDSYAFYQLEITNSTFTNVTYIDSYSFYETWLRSLTANAVSIIGDYAFFNTPIESLNINNVTTIGNYAFANCTSMYEASVGTVSIIGDYAFHNCVQMQTFSINNSNSMYVNNLETINLTIGEDALFSNWGSYIDGRLRMYVPDLTLASGNTVVSLYREMFYDNSNYIYVTGRATLGIDATYTHLAVPHALSSYTVRVITITKPNNEEVTGYEIVSYQGKNLEDNIPTSLTTTLGTMDVISIGYGAYQNSSINNNYSVSIESEVLLNVGDKSFKNFGLDHIVAPNINYIGVSSFEASTIHYAYFEDLNSVGSRAFYNCTNLYRVRLGDVISIGSSAFANTSNLTSVFFTNTSTSAIYSGNAFDNAGSNISNRFRMYVPDTNESLVFYQSAFSTFSDYIYPTGIIVGTYTYGSINFNIGEYSVREITKPDANGNNISGMELIEYHGADLTSSYTLPLTVNPSSDLLDISYSIQNSGTTDATIEVILTNTSVEEITGWEVDVEIQGDIYGQTNEYATATNNSGYIAFTNSSASSGRILAGASKVIYLHILGTSTTISSINVLDVLSTTANSATYDIISIGDNAFKHVYATTNATFNLESSNVLYIGEYAFAYMTEIRHATFNNVVTIDNSAFESSGVTQVSFHKLNYMGNSVLKNANNLYIADLGKVQTMGSDSITNAPYLYQIKFDVPSNIGLTINSSVFSNIGTSTGDRLRIYVTNGRNVANEEYSSIYKSHFPTYYQDYFYSYDYIVGSYVPDGIVDTIDIGEYSVKSVTINSQTGYEFVEYHGADISSGYEFPTMLDLNDNALSATVTWGSPYANSGSYVTDVTVHITNNSDDPISTWKVTLNVPVSGTISGVTTWNNGASYSGTKVILTQPAYPTPITSGETYDLQLQITHSLNAFSATVSSIKQNNTSDDIPIISIGDFAYKHASFNGTASFNIESNYIIYIGNSAFANNTGIRNINVPNCITVSDNAFNNATNLITARFNSLNSLGDSALYNDTSLIVVDLGNIRTIGDNALYGTTNVARLIFRSTVVASGGSTMDITIGNNAFTNCGTTIGSRLRVYVPYVNATSYVESYKNTLPTAYNSYIYEIGEIIGSSTFNNYDIGEYAVRQVIINGRTAWQIIEYHGADISSSFSIPSTSGLNVSGVDDAIISIGDRAFVLTSVSSGYSWNLELPASIVYVGNYAFYQRSVTSVSGNELIYIGQYAFANNSTLTNITFNSVNTIGGYAFYYNTNLRTAVLGTNVQEIQDYAFYIDRTSNKLSRIYINTSTPPVVYSNSLPPTSYFIWGTTAYIYVPYNSVSTYQGTSIWSNYYIRSIGDTYQNVYIYEIINNDEIKITGYLGSGQNRTIPDTFTISNVTYNVVQIAPDVFDGITGLTTLKLGANIKNVGNGFLSGNTSVRNINVSSNNTYFKSTTSSSPGGVAGVLLSYDEETLIKFPPGKNLTGNSYTLPSTIKVIANRAFENASNISTININANVVAISETAFKNANNLRTVNFASSVPPYLMGFEFLPIYVTSINYPLDNGVDRYEGNVFFSWYEDYLFGY